MADRNIAKQPGPSKTPTRTSKMNCCECYRISFDALRAIARRRGIRTVEELQAWTGAGTGCGSCARYLSDVFTADRDQPETPTNAAYSDLRDVLGEE